MQRRQRRRRTTVDAYIERCALKTAKLFEAACVLGGGESLQEFGANLGIVFDRRHPRLHRADDRDGQGRRHGSA
jgi:geranylgeranyl pyrophosphate synthase